MPVVVKLCLTSQCLRREANPDPAATWFCLLLALASWSLVWPWQDIGSPATSKATGANSAAGKKSSMQNGQLTLIIHEAVGAIRRTWSLWQRSGQCPRQHQESPGTAHLPGDTALVQKGSDTPKCNLPTQFSREFQRGRSSEKTSVEVCSKAAQTWTSSVVVIGVTVRKNHSLTALNCSELGLQCNITPL